MRHCGDPALWSDLFPDGLVPDIIELIVGTWAGFPKPGESEWEVPITRRFCCALRAARNSRRLPFAIWWESPELDDERAVEKGRIDLRFSHGYREKVYFAVECKRLNVMSAGKRRSLAMAYVEEGMMRFITGKYARSLDKGAMLGYVMDARVADAVEAVRHAVEARRCQLQMPQRGSLVSSRFRSKAATVKETNHDVDEMAFLIYHIFVSCSYSIG